VSEPMIPKSMHVAAVEAARTFARQEAEQKALGLIACIVEAAGGEVRVSRRAMVDDAPDLLLSEDPTDPFSNVDIYRTKRR
jgi:hypothetical protein